MGGSAGGAGGTTAATSGGALMVRPVRHFSLLSKVFDACTYTSDIIRKLNKNKQFWYVCEQMPICSPAGDMSGFK